MIDFPNAKINLGLYITAKRADGYHNVATLFYPVPLTDSLEIIPYQIQGTEDTWVQSLPAPIIEKIVHPDNPVQFTSLKGEIIRNGTICIEKSPIYYSQSGLAIEGSPHQNLCVRAYEILKNHFPELPGIQVHLHKTIPAGAGLGGGSADGAFTLRMLNQLFDLELSTMQLKQFAAQLGSDCSFFIDNQPALGSGRGEILEPVQLDLSAYHLVLIHPGIHVSTAKAFAAIEPLALETQHHYASIIGASPRHWRGKLENVFEGPVFRQYPVIGALKQQMYDKGAVYAGMSGTGSTVFGLFESAMQRKDFELRADYLFYQVKL